MATRFAVRSGNWSTGSTWDNGSVPLTGDTIYPNAYLVTIDTDISVASLINSISNVYLPNISTPAMTSNYQPTGTVASSNNSGTAYFAFDQAGSGSYWISNAVSGWTSYTFPNPKIIKRYFIRQGSAGQNSNSRNWTFEGYNTTTSNWDILDTVTGFTTNANYTSVLINPSNLSFTSYRINVTATFGGAAVAIGELEMTEESSLTPIYGASNGGYFQVPSTFTAGTLNLTFSSGGITLNNLADARILVLAHNLSATVNLNVIGRGYIINPNYQSINTNAWPLQITGSGNVIFNSDLWGLQQTYYNTYGTVQVTSNAKITINGNVYGGKGGSGANAYTLNFTSTSSSAVLNINGSVIATNGLAVSTAIYIQSVITVNVVGNLISDIAPCIASTSTVYLNITGLVSYTNASSAVPITTAGSSIINITGSITAPPNNIGLNCGAGAATVNIPTGVVIAGTNAVGISAPSATLVTVFGPLINTNNTMAVYTNRLRFYSGTTTQWRFQDTANATRVLYQSGYTGTTIGLPASIDVRKNTVYGQYNELTGTLVVPSPSDVRINVLTDNTVGTGQLTAEDFLNAITASTLPIAIRLQNISTTQTMGTQLAALSGRT